MKATIVRLAVLPESQEIASTVTGVHQTLQHSCCIVLPPNQDLLYFLLIAFFFNCRVQGDMVCVCVCVCVCVRVRVSHLPDVNGQATQVTKIV